MADDLAARVDELEAKLDAVTGIPAIHRALTRTDPNNDWSVQEYAMCMGVNRSTVYTWINSGRLRHYKAGGRIRIPFGTDPTPKENAQ